MIFLLKKTFFSLIELLTSVALILILMTLLVPSLQKMRHHTLAIECSSNQKSVYTAIYIYSDDNFGSLPGPCDRSAGAVFDNSAVKRKGNFQSLGEQRLSNYLYHYLSSPILGDNGESAQRLYLPDLTCPANLEMTFKKGSFTRRPQFLLLEDNFGYNYFGNPTNGSLPYLISEISSPNQSAALRDIRDPDKSSLRMPHFPIHNGFNENVLMFDGSVVYEFIHNP